MPTLQELYSALRDSRTAGSAADELGRRIDSEIRALDEEVLRACDGFSRIRERRNQLAAQSEALRAQIPSHYDTRHEVVKSDWDLLRVVRALAARGWK